MAKAEKSLADLDREIKAAEKVLKTAQKKREELRKLTMFRDVFAYLGQDLVSAHGPNLLRQQYEKAGPDLKKAFDKAGYAEVLADLMKEHAASPKPAVMPSQPAPPAGAPRTPTES